jgi:hypothetical protein
MAQKQSDSNPGEHGQSPDGRGGKKDKNMCVGKGHDFFWF